MSCLSPSTWCGATDGRCLIVVPPMGAVAEDPPSSRHGVALIYDYDYYDYYYYYY